MGVSILRNKIFISLLLLMMIPSFIYTFFQMSSLAVGLTFGCFLCMLLCSEDGFSFSIKELFLFWLLFCLLLIHVVFLHLTKGFVKPWSSFVLLFSLIPLYRLSALYGSVSVDYLEFGVKGFIGLMFFIGWLNFLYYFVSGLSWRGEYFPLPFSEPSLYALCLGVVCGGYSMISSRRYFLFMVANIFAFGVLVPSLTSLIYFFMMCFFRFVSGRRLNAMAVVFLSPLIFFSVWMGLSFNPYFTERLDFTSENISSLVWLQGWQLIFLNLVNTDGLGIGIQLLGIDGDLGSITYRLQELAGKYVSLSSGGFLISKLVSELGVLGVLFGLVYCVFLLRFLRFIVSCWKGDGEVSKKKAFLGGMVFFFSIELFFRGYGYFSSGAYLTVMAFFEPPWVSRRLHLLRNWSHYAKTT